MTGLLAYDPDHLRRLRGRLADVADHYVQAADPLAADAVRLSRQAQELARAAVQRVDAVLAADPLGAGAGGSLAIDPSSMAITDAAAHAARLGSAVAALPRVALTPLLLAELAKEADRLRWSRPAAIAFTEALGPGGLARLGHPVSAALLDGDTSTRASFSSIARAVGVAATADQRIADRLTSELRTGDAHVAALILAEARLPSAVVAAVLPTLLHQATAHPPVLAPLGPTVAALLADALVALPDLTRALLPTLPIADLRELLEGPYGSAAASAGRVLAQATDTSTGPLAEVVAFTDWLVRKLHEVPALIGGPLGMFLGTALSSWILDLAPIDRSAYPELPPSRLPSAALGAEILRNAAARPGSAIALTAAADDVLSTELAAVATDQNYEHGMQPYVVLSASLDAWVVEGARHAADEERKQWEWIVNLLAEGANQATRVLPKAVSLVARFFVPTGVRAVAEAIGGPPDARTNARLAEDARWSRQAIARDAAADGLFAGTIAAGLLPAGTPPPPRTVTTALSACSGDCDPAKAGALDQEASARAMDDWVADAPTAAQRDARQDLRARIDAVTRIYTTRVEAER